MTVWIIVIAMTLIATACVVLPLLRRRHREDEPAAYDIEVYKDQLNQVGQDYDRGLMSTEQAQAAKTEISRRLLNADARLQAATERQQQRQSTGQTVVIAIVALIVPLGALGLYGLQGAPDIAGMPFAERASSRTQTAAEVTPPNLDAAAAQLQQRLDKNPSDLQGWLLLARTYMSIQRYGNAVLAYEKALGLDGGNADITSGYGEALFLAAGEVVTPASRTAFEDTLKKRPGEPRARFYLALAEFQAGDKQKALDGWAALVADSPADAPWLEAVRARVTATATELGLDVASVMPKPLPPRGEVTDLSKRPGGGPSLEDMEEAAKLSPEERAERIRDMVAGLAAKMEENPQNFQGWMQLIRAYAVQKQTDKAKEALAKARGHFQKAPFPMQQLAELANELKLEGDAPRGPTNEDVKAAQEMSPEDRQAMIESMVGQLAERLKDNPNDVAGWTRLARSYTVLGKNDKAQDALAQALKVTPDNIDLLILYGRTSRSMNGDRSTPESLDAMRKVLALNPKHVEALWFLGGDAAQAGNKAVAKSLWERAIAQFPAGAPERTQLRARIDQLK